jgi:cytochrome c oxidase subunit 3
MMIETVAEESKLVTARKSARSGAVVADRLAAGESAAEGTVAIPPSTAALCAVLATVLMLFAGFTSAYMIRRASPDWIPVYAPPVLWLNTALLLFSSLALEIARTSRKFGKQAAYRGWFLTAVGLGGGFLWGQWTAWRNLAEQGIFLPSSPHGSFFYMLSGVHAFHVVAGLLALGIVLIRRWSAAEPSGAGDPVTLCSVYWHFVSGIWVFLYWLLFVWR